MPRNKGRPGDPDRREALESLLDLAYDASSYLRQNKQPVVRVSAAILIAASLAACGQSPSAAAPPPAAVVQPLSQEVRVGLPTTPGTYPLIQGSLNRDQQGVYHFAWRNPSDPTNVRHDASVSLVRLAQTTNGDALEVLAQGDPILHLGQNTSVPIVDNANYVSSGYRRSYPVWYPFYANHDASPRYYDLPSRTIPDSGSIQGSKVSSAPAAPAARVVGPARAVSGRAGGTGSGVAASNKSGAGISAESHAVGVSASKASGFSAGHASASSAGGASSS